MKTIPKKKVFKTFAVRAAALLCLLPLLSYDQITNVDARPMPGIIGADDRQPLPQNEVPWQAIGQINIAGYRKKKSCTGTLVAPDKVLTAAHCLINAVSQKPTSKEKIHFVAGVSHGTYLAHAKAKCFFTHRDYKPLKGRYLPFSRDLALIILKKKLPLQPIALTQKMAPLKQKRLIHASYSGDRRYALTAHKNCQRIQNHQGIWLTDCDTHFGSSGGPVMIPENGHLVVTAIMAGIIVKHYTIAVPVQPWINFIKNAHCG